MRKTLTAALAASAMVVALAGTTLGAHGGEPTLIVMQHICNPSIQSEADFVAAEDAGAGGQPGGEGTLPGLVATVLACPTVVLSGDAPTDGIGATPTDFDYTVVDSAAADYTLSSDGMLMAAKLCESDIALDVDGDGTMSPDTCLDVSMYSFEPVAEGAVTATQTAAVGDSRFGTIRFTPASTDEMALVAAASGVIELDTSLDTQVDSPPLPLAEYNDDVVVTHIYNFQNVAAAPSVTPAPAVSMMPNAAMENSASSTTSGLLLLVGGLFATSLAGMVVLGKRRNR